VLLPLTLYVLFAFLSVVGAYLAAAHVRDRTAGMWAALATLLFFVLLAAGLFLLLRSGGFA
jgi:hypothetical protein